MGWFTKVDNLSAKSNAVQTMTEVSCVGICDSKLADVMVKNLYTRIIHKCFSRAILPEDVEKAAFNMSIYDSYSPYKLGLASIVVEALFNMKKVYVEVTTTNRGVKLFNVLSSSATDAEKDAANVIELDFTNYYQVEVIKLLYCLLLGVLTAIDKGITVSQAMVFKLNKLSEMVQNGSTDKVLREQLTQLNDSITQGNAGFIDGQSDIIFPQYNAEPAQKALDLIYGVIANITGLPMSFINAETVGGLGSTSDSDNQRLNDAIEYYYFNIVNNILYAVYNKVFEFKQFVDDINGLVSMFAFIETTELLTDEGKLKFMRNNTGFSDEDININVSDE